METKKVTEDFSDRGSPTWDIEAIKSRLTMVEICYEECDAELAKAGLASLGYEAQDMSTMLGHLLLLRKYVENAYDQCYDVLDHPLYKAFTNGATQTLSEIVLDDITTENTFNMQEYVEVSQAYRSMYRNRVKTELTMSDFLGLEDVVPGEGLPVLENVETLGWFTYMFRADYEKMSGSVESIDQMLMLYLVGGEYAHEEYHPIGNFVSGLLDITVVKPLIESITGTDMITGEHLTDFERGMQLVNAVVGIVTLGQGALALDLASMTGKEVALELAKMWGVDAIADTASYVAGYTSDALGLPEGVTFLASLLTGCTVSVKAGKYVFQDANRNIVQELDADEMKNFLKGMDVELEDIAWGGRIGTNKTSMDACESLLGPMSEEELKRYMKFLEDGSTAGMTPAELSAIQKVDERLLLDQIDYDAVLALRRSASGGGEYSGGEWYNYFVDIYGKENVQGTFFNEIKYEPTSRVAFTPTTGKTTTILGRYDTDTQYIFDETGNIKSLSYDGHEGGFNLLNVPDELSNVSGGDFWNDYNAPFLDEAIGRNDVFFLATEINQSSLYRVNKETGMLELSGFGKEIKYLESKGYVFDKDLMQMVPGQ